MEAARLDVLGSCVVGSIAQKTLETLGKTTMRRQSANDRTIIILQLRIFALVE